MGIDGFWKDEDVSSCAKVIPQESFKGYRISIDAGHYLFQKRMVARKSVAMKWNVAERPVDEDAIDGVHRRIVLDDVIIMLYSGITPVFVFETSAPKLKKETQDGRVNKKLENEERMKELRAEIKEKGPFESSKLIEELRKKECVHPSYTANSRELMFSFLFDMGLPCVFCADEIEAERVASILCIENLCAAVMSADSDCQAIGAPIQIKEKKHMNGEDGEYVPAFSVYYNQDIREKMNLTQRQLTDTCIAAGCDYNQGLKGVAFPTAKKLMQQHGTLLRFPKKHDIESLDRDECRKYFSTKAPRKLIEEDCHRAMDSAEEWKDLSEFLVLDTNAYVDAFSKYEVSGYDLKYAGIMEDFPKCKDFVHGTDVLEGVRDDEDFGVKRKFTRK